MKLMNICFAGALMLFAPASAQAGGMDPFEAVRLFTGVVDQVQRTQSQMAARERAAEARAREQARVAALQRTKAGRAQLAKEEAARKRQQQLAIGLAVGLLGGGGSGGGSNGSVSSPGGYTPDDYRHYKQMHDEDPVRNRYLMH